MSIKQYGSIHEFIYDHKQKHPGSHFFDAETLKFFGERLSEMRILKTISTITDGDGETRHCYCLSRLQRPPFSGPVRKYTYFDVHTLDEVLL